MKILRHFFATRIELVNNRRLTPVNQNNNRGMRSIMTTTGLSKIDQNYYNMHSETVSGLRFLVDTLLEDQKSCWPIRL